jgi:hypothetical protein
LENVAVATAWVVAPFLLSTVGFADTLTDEIVGAAGAGADEGDVGVLLPLQAAAEIRSRIGPVLSVGIGVPPKTVTASAFWLQGRCQGL